MKRLFTIMAVTILTVSGFAQAPQKMSYQAVIRNSSDQLVTNQAVGMRISILRGSSDGTPVYVETQTPITNANGLISIEIGVVIPVTGVFANIDWSNGTYYIKTETDPSGGTDYNSIVGTSQILSVPYAFYAKSAGTSDALQSQINMLKISSAAGGVVSDVDHNLYNVVKIGTQVWMAENLKTTRYNDGTAIPNVPENITWRGLTTSAYSDFINLSDNSNIYGRLYNWYAIDNNSATKIASNGGKNVCPTGWHVPNDSEWTTLIDYLTNNGYGYEGSGNDIAKSMAATSVWIENETVGSPGNDQSSNNSSGFSALPGGLRTIDGGYGWFGTESCWWTAGVTSVGYGHLVSIFYDESLVHRITCNAQFGLAVRCLRD